MKKLVLALAVPFLAAVPFVLERPSTAERTESVLARPALAPSSNVVAPRQLVDTTTIAPAGTWQCEGGSLSRSRLTETRAIEKGPLDVMATIQPEGELDAEPVYDSRYVVTVSADSKGKRVLEVFDIETGKRRGGAKKLDIDERVSPCYVDGLVAVRSALDEIEVYKVGRGGLSRSWAIDSKEGDFGHPILVDGDVVVMRGDAIERWQMRKSSPEWSTSGVFRGALALDDESLYAVEYDRKTNAAQLVELDVTDGSERSRRGVGQREGGTPLFPGRDIVAVNGKFAVVFAESRVKLEGGMSSQSVGVDLSAPANAESTAGVALTTFMIDPPAMLGTAWMSFYDMPSEGRMALVSNGTMPDGESEQRGPMVLASAQTHNEVLKNHQAPVFAQNVSYFAGLAWDLPSQRVLWREKGMEGAKLFPGKECVLAVRDGTSIEIWRRHRDPAPQLAIVAQNRPSAAKGVLVLRDGEVETGNFELRGEGDALEIAKVGSGSSRGYPVSNVFFAAHDDGTVLYAADREALLDGIDDVVGEAQLESIDKLVSVAAKCGDLPLMTQVLVKALQLGSEKTDKLEEAIVDAREKKPRANEKNMERTREGLAELRGVRRDMAWHSLEALWREPKEGERVAREIYALLGVTLGADPGFEPARERLAALLPEGIELPEDESVVEWTAFAEANALHPVSMWVPPQSFDKALTWEQERLDDASRWREDIIGFRTENLFVITPLARPGSVARCLVLSEQLCSILSKIFAGGDNERDTRHPLVMYLFESKEEYLRVSAGESKEDQAGLAWTAGHYNPREGVSRLFLPADEDADWSSVTETLLHELTHHWIDQRCTRIPAGIDKDARFNQPGYWIVEGFASLLEDFQLDPFAETYESTSARSSRLDLVTNANDTQLLIWKKLFRCEHSKMFGLQMDSTEPVALTWMLGPMALPGGVGFFYAQSSTVCHYCFNAEGGALRDELVDYVVNYYCGNAEMMDVEKAFGMTEEELGKRAVKWAREYVRSSIGD
ncbi:MAG: hypothetical protein R3F34_15590 [Planctomycetota bacterium]